MKRQIILAADVEAAKGTHELPIAANALVTPQAADRARELKIQLVRTPSASSFSPGAGGAVHQGSLPAPRPETTLPPPPVTANAAPGSLAQVLAHDVLPDIRDIDYTERALVPHPKNAAALRSFKKLTPARIGVWRAGPRYLTECLLRFRADHAAAVDAAFTDVSQAFLQSLQLPAFTTLCRDRDEFLRRPDLGRNLPPEHIKAIQSLVGSAPKVLVYFGDGLSSTAIEANGAATYQSLVAGLRHHGVECAPPFFVQYCRVPAQDVIAEATGAEVICTFIGERPGLATAESMSAYFTYKATVGMPEARRTVISNIHKGGTPAVEAGAYIADIIITMLREKASGIDLPL